MSDLTQLRAELRAELAAYDREVAWHVDNYDGDRADLWTDIDVPVAAVRSLLDALDALQAERDEARAQRDYWRGRDKAGCEIEVELRARVTALEKGLEPFALPEGWHFIAYNKTGSTACPLNAGEVERARALLNPKEGSASDAD